MPLGLASYDRSGSRTVRRRIHNPRALLVVAAVCARSGSQGAPGPQQSTDTASEPGAVAELKSVDTLREAFDADAGNPRLLLLLSPT